MMQKSARKLRRTRGNHGCPAPVLPELQFDDVQHATITDPDLIRFWVQRCEAVRNIERLNRQMDEHTATAGARVNDERTQALFRKLNPEESRLKAFDKAFWGRVLRLYPELKDILKDIKVRQGYVLVTRPERCPPPLKWLNALWKMVYEPFAKMPEKAE